MDCGTESVLMIIISRNVIILLPAPTVIPNFNTTLRRVPLRHEHVNA